jgi:hypothetical protein
MPDTSCVLARFENYHGFLSALRALKESGKYHYEAYGPTNLNEIEDLMPVKGSRVRIWATIGGLIGMATFWLMCVLSSLIYSIVTGGKPPISNVPFVIPAYEGTILFGAIGTFVSVAFSIRFVPRSPQAPYHSRFSDDSYGVAVYCAQREQAQVEAMMKEMEAVEVAEVKTDE